MKIVRLLAALLAAAFGSLAFSVAAIADVPVLTVSAQTQSFTNLGAPIQISTGPRTVYMVGINNTQAALPAFPQLFNAATTPTLGTLVVWQSTCPALSYCFIVLGSGLYFPTGVWLGSAAAINGSSASASGVQAYAGFQ